MPNSSGSSRSPVSRKVLKLGLTVVAVVCVYSIGWHIAADQLKTRVVAAMETDGTTAPKVECREPASNGFPFRIGIFCSSVEIDDLRNGVSATFGPFRSAAQVYNPSHIVWELDGPGEIRSALGLTGMAEWSALQASTRLDEGRLQSASLEFHDLKTSLTETTAGQTADLVAGRGELHMRRNGEDLDTAWLFENLTGTVRGISATLPPIATSADVTIAGKGELLARPLNYPSDLYGSRGELRRLVADLGEGRTVTVTGPFSIGTDGLISGEFNVTIEKLAAWNQSLSSSLPQMKPAFDAATSILRSLAAGGDNSSARIVIRDGVVMLSFIPIGTLPPI